MSPPNADLEPSPPSLTAMTPWLGARARNALRRPLRIIGVSSTAFIAALLTLILIPHETTRAAARMVASTRQRPDTLALVQRIADLQADDAAAVRDLARDRLRLRAQQEAVRDSIRALAAAGGQASRRDSLMALRDELDALLSRAARSPLPASYRALGGAQALRGDARVAALLDSLSDVTRARDGLPSGDATNPVYLALTTRLTGIGRSLEAIAAARAGIVGKELAAAGAPASSPSVAAARVDTLAGRTRVDAAGRALAAATGALREARRVDSMFDARAEAARTIASGSAPPLALMAAALVLGVAVGFAVTFGGELWRPRVSDGREATRVTGVPTLATVGPRVIDPRRMRRKTDQNVSALIDINSESYRYVYLSVSAPDAAAALGVPLVAVTGDEAEVVGTVATNIAVASAHDSRTTLLIDADTEAAVVAGILNVPRSPGVADVLAGRAEWSSIVASAVVGRERSLNVMPAGNARTVTGRERALAGDVAPSLDVVEPIASEDEDAASVDASGEADAAELRAELLRLGRRYDLVVVAAPAGAAQIGPDSILPVREAIVCVRVAYTPLARLVTAIATLRESRLRVRGIVLWDADVPPRLAAS